MYTIQNGVDSLMQIHVAENVKYTFHEAITNDSNTYPGSI